jgi:adenine phosphoribosyltransferase
MMELIFLCPRIADPDGSLNNLNYDLIRGSIKSVNDYPKKGIVFRDITPLLKDSRAFSTCIDGMAEWADGKGADYIVSIEARGFIIGAALAARLGLGFIPVRKKGKLPRKTVSKKYTIEYAEREMEMHEDAIEKGSRVLIVDDLLATGGTARAAADLIESVGGKVVGIGFVVELTDLKGRDIIKKYDVFSLVKY